MKTLMLHRVLPRRSDNSQIQLASATVGLMPKNT